jgi:hypothetical protein
METFMQMVAGILLAALVMFTFGLLLAFPVMWLWNAFMPEVFGVPTITFWQAFGMKLLAALMFPPTTVSSK